MRAQGEDSNRCGVWEREMSENLIKFVTGKHACVTVDVANVITGIDMNT